MRAEHEGAALFDRLEYLFDHAYGADFSLPRAYPRGPRPRFETLPSLLDPLQQLFYSPFVLLRVVKIKEKFRHMAQSQPLQHLMANESLGGIQSSQRLFRL